MKTKTIFMMMCLGLGFIAAPRLMQAEKITGKAVYGVGGGKNVLVVEMYKLALKEIIGTVNSPQTKLLRIAQYQEAFNGSPSVEYFSSAMSPKGDKIAVGVKAEKFVYVLVYNTGDLKLLNHIPLSSDKKVDAKKGPVLGFSYNGDYVFVGTDVGFDRWSIDRSSESNKHYTVEEPALNFASSPNYQFLVFKTQGLIQYTNGQQNTFNIPYTNGNLFNVRGYGDVYVERKQWFDVVVDGSGFKLQELKLGLADNKDTCETPAGVYSLNDSGVYHIDLKAVAKTPIDTAQYDKCFYTSQGLGVLTTAGDFKIIPFPPRK